MGGSRVGCRGGAILRGGAGLAVYAGVVVQTELVKRSKGARRMPRRGQAMKDVASCDKPGGAARGL